jgi:rare lipoprotein A
MKITQARRFKKNDCSSSQVINLFRMLRWPAVLTTLLRAGLILGLMVLTACSTLPPFLQGSILQRQDTAPRQRINPDLLVDAIPRRGQVKRAGNKNPYTVLGKTYHLLPSSDGYKEEGTASWYGTKFHGRPTANGERYSLYAMTAAHKTLPIPAYVKVTNLENQKTVIVRVNDRGPFHEGRIIDLSYAAAVKLGYAEKGTAQVSVEVVYPGGEKKRPVVEAKPGRYFLQVGAFKNLQSANTLRTELLSVTERDVEVSMSEPPGFYRVQVGPLAELTDVQQVSDQLISKGLGQPRLISK